MTYTREIMRILISIGSLGLGGAEKQAVWLANKLSETHEVTLLTYHGGAREKDLSEKVLWKTIFPETTLENEVHENVNNLLKMSNPIYEHTGPKRKNYGLKFKIPQKVKRVISFLIQKFIRLMRKITRIPGRVRYLINTRLIDRVILKYRNYTFVFFSARKVIHKSNPDVVITFLFHDTLNVGLASKLRFKKTKLIVGRRSPAGYADKSRPFLHRLILRLVYWRADFAVSNSNANLENAIKEGLNSKKIIYIPNYVEIGKLKTFNEQANVPLKIVCLANFLWYKNHSGLLSAISQIPNHEQRFHFTFVGDGPLLESTKKLATSLNINANFVGFIQDPREIISSCDAMILVSHFEGSSNALLEGLSAGIPAISSATGSATELKELGGPLLICDSKSKESIANSLTQLEDRYGELFSVAQKFSRKIEEIYSEKSVFDSWEKVISTN